MAARKGAMEGIKAMVVGINEYAHAYALLGGAFVLVGGTCAYLARQMVELRDQLKFMEMQGQKDVEAASLRARMDVEAASLRARIDVEAARRDVEAARRETAEKFLTYGFAEEYSNYQKLLKLKQAQERNGDK